MRLRRGGRSWACAGLRVQKDGHGDRDECVSAVMRDGGECVSAVMRAGDGTPAGLDADCQQCRTLRASGSQPARCHDRRLGNAP